MKLVAISLALTVPLVLGATPAQAQAETQTPLVERADDVVAVIKGIQAPEDIFAPSFLAAVPAEQFNAISQQLIAQFGPIQGVDSVEQKGENAAMVVLRFEKALATVALSVESSEPHLINGLLIQSTEMLGDTAEKIRAELEALPGDVGVLLTRLDGTVPPELAMKADRQFAIGSTFKLYILSALARSIENGERSWSDVVELNRKSFPSGTMQDWPEGAPVTLHTLATMMISISDNTATDILLYEVGREAVEAELLASGHSDPEKTLPFLSTLQMFGLKGSPDNLRKYVDGNEKTQRMMLADFEDDIGGNVNLVTPPRFIEPFAIDTVEWFASGRDLAQLAKRLATLTDPTARNIMAVSTAMPQDMENEWAYAGYKGGSEPGVLNLTWLLQDEAGRWWMLSMSWNNTDANVEHSKFEQLGQRILALANN